jgi:hypothetical protein
MNIKVKGSEPRELSLLTHTSSSAVQITSTGSPITIGARHGHAVEPSKNIENAVYAYIRAIRALGKTTINTADIAAALELAIADVDRTLSALKKKGVKVD